MAQLRSYSAISKVSLKENCMHISWYEQGQLAIYETVLTMQNFNSPLLEGILKKLKAIKYGVLTVATKYISSLVSSLFQNLNMY